MRRTEANRRAKERYIDELFSSGIREITEKFRSLNAEYDDALKKEETDGKARVFQPLRIGAACPDANSLDGSNYFHGQISLVAVYPHCLTPDRVKTHFLCGSNEV